MAKKRTKKDKIRTSKKQKSKKIDAKLETIVTASVPSKKDYSKINKTKKSLPYDFSYVINDLKKTFIVTLIVLIVLGIIALLYT